MPPCFCSALALLLLCFCSGRPRPPRARIPHPLASHFNTNCRPQLPRRLPPGPRRLPHAGHLHALREPFLLMQLESRVMLILSTTLVSLPLTICARKARAQHREFQHSGNRQRCPPWHRKRRPHTAHTHLWLGQDVLPGRRGVRQHREESKAVRGRAVGRPGGLGLWAGGLGRGRDAAAVLGGVPVGQLVRGVPRLAVHCKRQDVACVLFSASMGSEGG